MPKLTKAAMPALLLTLASIGTARAQYYDDDDYGYSDPDIRQTVARVAYISGDVSFARGDDPDDWQPADANIPMTLGDRTWTSGGRLELQVHGGNIIRLAQSTDLTALNLTEDTKQFSMTAGVASFRIRRLLDDEIFEVDTPNAAVTFERTGDYRINVRPDGDTEILVRRGRAYVASGGGQVPLGAGDAMFVEGYQPPRYDLVNLPSPDGWDRWVAERDARYANVRSYEYVSPDIAGVEDLDVYGSWQQIPSYGWSWTPARVAVGWQPYRVGRWIWQDPWGWTWVSSEPWGWAPYHYGRWVVYSSRWFWVPVAPRVQVVAYSPALVGFVGGGPGFSVSVGVGTGYVGWFPLAPREPLIPWWGRPATTVVNVTNITYVNKTYVTVVNQNTFVSSRAVNTNYVRDQNIVSRIERAPVVRGAVPIMPTRESIRVTTREARAARPPSAIAQRAVVTRVAPPPAPPRFDRKVAVIREQKRPVTTVEAESIVTREGRPAPARAVRPASEEGGRVSLAPKTQSARAPRPEPVAPSRGRQLATKEQPVAASRAPSAQRGRPTGDAATESSQRESAQRERAQREKEEDKRDQAARDARAQDQRDRTPQGQRDRTPQGQIESQQSQRDRAQQEQLQRQQAQRDRAQQEQLERQQAQRDKAQQEQLERQQAQRDKAQQEQLERQQSQREKAQQEQRQQAQREQAQQQQAQREKAQQDQLERQEAERQQNQRQQVQRQQAPRPTARPAPDAQPERAQADNPNGGSKRQTPPDAQTEKDKDKPASSQRGRGRPTPKPTPDKQG